MINKIKYFILKKIYADHNDSKVIKKTLKDIMKNMPLDFVGLNIGSGMTKLHENIKNMELESGDNIDYVGSVENIPCGDSEFDLIITQEVLEHVRNPNKAMSEIYRVLKKSSIAYIQLPFIIGYHPCPNDYWRYTHQGIEELAKSSGFEVLKIEASVGPAVGFYRILVEFFSVLIAVINHRLYRIFKLLFAILFYPIKLLDPIMIKSPEAIRINGGYFVVCRKR